MQQYYLHIDGLPPGPYTLQQVQNLHIPPHTMVWHQGASAWAMASTFPELQQHLHSSPPPHSKSGNRSSTFDTIEMLSQPKPRKFNSKLLIVIIIPLLMASISYINYQMHANSNAKIEDRLAADQKQIDQQQQHIDDKEYLDENPPLNQMQRDSLRKLSPSRLQQHNKDRLAAKLQKTKDEYAITLQQLVLEQAKLQDVKSFQFFRRKYRREAQIDIQQERVNSVQRRADRQKAYIIRYQ